MPVLAPKHQALVTRDVREKSLATMCGLLPAENDDNKEDAEEQQDDKEALDQQQAEEESRKVQQEAAISAVKKRKLYRQVSGTEVPWFPHDNHADLLQEFCWEAGQPRWVLYGTPASAAGVMGCLEFGASVVALCADDHHKTWFNKFLLERAVESMVGGQTLVFSNEALQDQAVQLQVCGTDNKKKQPPKEENNDKEKEKEKDRKTAKKDKKNDKTPKKDKKDKKTLKDNAKPKQDKKKEDADENDDEAGSSSDPTGSSDEGSSEEAQPSPEKKARKN